MTRLVMMGGALPQRLAPSAGTEYVTVLAEELSRSFEVVAIAPAFEANQAAVEEGRIVVSSRLVGVGKHSLSRRLVGLVERAARVIDLAFPPLYFAATLFLDGEIRRQIRAADVVDLQWTEFVALAPLVRLLNRRAVIRGTMHDSMTQLAERTSRGSGVRSLIHPLRRLVTASHEGRLAASLSSLQVLSAKDARLIADLPGAVTTPEVIHPPRPEPILDRHEASPPEVLFVAAFGRAVNQEAVRWFLDEVWPAILQSQPDAQLVLAGSDPQSVAAEAAEGWPAVRATGFVEDLGWCYGRASVVVVPLRNGSGVKFKTIDAVLHGVPVVSTTVGVEGIEGDDLFWAVTDSAQEFAAAVSGAMKSPAAKTRAVEASRRVAARYSRSAFARSVERVYGNLP